MPRIVIAGIPVLLALVATPLLMILVVRGRVTPQRLDRSVAGAAGRMSYLPCSPRPDAPGRWRCGVWIDAGRFSSGGVSYDVRVPDGGSCWSAEIAPAVAKEARVPARLHGCVRRWQLPG